MIINTGVIGRNCFYGYYNQDVNKIYLRNNDGTKWLGAITPGTNQIIENDYAKLDCSKTTVTGSGDTLTIKWAVTFKESFAGKTYNTYLFARDDTDAQTKWEKKGTWGVLAEDTTPPQITGVTPVDGSSFYEGDTISIFPTVNDQDPSPLEYQFLIDGIIKQAWSNSSSYGWTPSSQDIGVCNIKVQVRDTGGEDTIETEVYVFRKPLLP